PHRIDTKVSYSLGTPVSYYFLVWRIPETGDRSEKENGSRVILAFVSQPIRSSQIAYCYTCGLLSAGAAQGKLPEDQKNPLFTLRIILHYSTEWNEKKTDEKSSVFLR
ncbi:MAG: hypothetical protein U0O02_08580, partial [Eubacteriales bacterium]